MLALLLGPALPSTRSRRPAVIAACVLVLLLGSTGALAQSQSQRLQQQSAGAEEEEGDKEEAMPFPLSLSGTLTGFVGQGTFVPGPTNNPYVSADLFLSLYFSVGSVSLTIAEEMLLEVTDSDTTTTRWQPEIYDPWARLRWEMFRLPFLDFYGASYAHVTFPLSLQSRHAGSLGTVGAGGDAGFTIPYVDLVPYVSAVASYNLLVPQLAGITSSNVGTALSPSGAEIPSCITRAPQELYAYACGSVPSLLSTSLSSGVSGAWLDGLLSAGASVGLLSFLSAFIGPDDAYRAEHAVAGPVLNHYTNSSFYLALTPWPWLSFSVGTWTIQPLFTVDGKGYRFPLWDLVGVRDNWSTFYVSVTFTR